MKDANAHLHGVTTAKVERVDHFMSALADLSLCPHLVERPLNTFATSSRFSAQDDYLAISAGVHASHESAMVEDFAHVAEAAFHEPILIDVLVWPTPQAVTVSRRKPTFYRRKLSNPNVLVAVKQGLSEIEAPPIQV